MLKYSIHLMNLKHMAFSRKGTGVPIPDRPSYHTAKWTTFQSNEKSVVVYILKEGVMNLFGSTEIRATLKATTVALYFLIVSNPESSEVKIGT